MRYFVIDCILLMNGVLPTCANGRFFLINPLWQRLSNVVAPRSIRLFHPGVIPLLLITDMASGVFR